MILDAMLVEIFLQQWSEVCLRFQGDVEGNISETMGDWVEITFVRGPGKTGDEYFIPFSNERAQITPGSRVYGTKNRMGS